MKSFFKRLLRSAGYDLSRTGPPQSVRDRNPDVSEWEWAVYSKVKPYTMLSFNRVLANIRAVEYILRAGISGDVVECGVWRGGSAMSMALTLLSLHDTSRALWMYDTFEGMTNPNSVDVSHTGTSASSLLAAAKKHEKKERSLIWAYASLMDVQRNMATTNFPASRTTYVKGPVEETIPQTIPDKIAVLRLDTDWYESTRHELTHLYPRLSPGGILIIDDYGDWRGARKAVDEYFADQSVFLHRIDYTGRIVVKGHC